jgi:FixJ family two-component response regulator
MWYQYLGPIDAVSRQAHRCLVKSLDEESAIRRPLVAVIDDDESVRESLPDLLVEFGFRSKVFSSAEEFLASDTVGQMKCLVLDVAMPGMTGLDLQQELKVRGHNIPTVFITAQKDETVRKRALQGGAVGFLLKPFSDTALQRALSTALGLD